MTAPPWGHKPPPVDEAATYWNRPPPAMSPRCGYWLTRHHNGTWKPNRWIRHHNGTWKPNRWIRHHNGTWKPNRWIRRQGYHAAAERLGVWIWEYLHVIRPLFDEEDERLSPARIPTDRFISR